MSKAVVSFVLCTIIGYLAQEAGWSVAAMIGLAVVIGALVGFAE